MNKLEELRKKKGFTQKEMAEKLGIARSTYSGYEKGYFFPPITIAIKIKEILKYKKDDIFLVINDR